MGRVWKGRRCWAVMRAAVRVGGTAFSGNVLESEKKGVDGLGDVPPHAVAYWKKPFFTSSSAFELSDGMGIFAVLRRSCWCCMLCEMYYRSIL